MKKQSSTSTASTNDKVNKLIQRQEKELNKARRQLEIEAALERVRSLTMVMKHSAELSEIILTVYKELRQLDMALTRTLIWLFSENPDMFEVWVADTEADKTSFVMKQEVEHPYHKRMFEKWKERKSKWVYINEGEGKKDLDDYLFTKTAAVAVPEEVKAGIRAVDRIVNTFSFHNFGGIQADGAEELSDEKFEILYRFAKEFDLAYTRFLDLQKAEEQVQEAQIEAGLERVRAQAMAMHHTDDLVLTIEMFYEQMSILLDTPIVRCGAGLLNKKNSICELASASKNDNGKTFSVKGNIDMNGHPLLKNTYNHWLDQKEYYHVLSGSEIKKYYQYMTNQVAIYDFTDDEEQHFYFPMFSEGSFYVITKRELLDDELRVFRRFSSVLSLTYRRFNDLKRAEKQAREAEIEVALERIRSSSLAMQKSDELQKIVTVVIKELLDLGVTLDAGGGVIICTYIKDSKDFLQWMASPDFSHSGSYLLPYFDHPIMNDSWKFKESGVDFSSKSYSEEEKNSFFKHSFEHSDHKYFHDDLKKWILQTKKYVLSWAWSKNSAILIPSHTGMVPSESEKDILIRFSRVFDQAYTRFLDLQKAEAQAREAQIEAALERVRSRTMGMQHSDELQDAAMLLFQQVEALGVPVFGCGFNIWEVDRKAATAWMAGKDRLQPPFKTSSSEDIFLRIYKSAQKGDSLFVEEQGGEALKVHYEYMKSIPVFKEIADKMATAGQTFPTFQIMHCAFFSHGYLMFISFEPVQSAYDIFKRFAKVFEQTYTRFLDLQKAEKQAREAQIEAALERVRSRTMGMTKGEELADTALLLFEQITHLGIKPRSCGFLIMDDKSQTGEDWSANLDEKGGASIITGNLAFDQHPIIAEVVAAWHKGQPYYIGEVHGEELQEYYKAVTLHESTSNEIRDKVLVEARSEFTNSFYFGYGMMYVLTPSAISENQINIMLRFATVFKQTYTRFLDLQKAENQAREAQIEAALEKVRSRTMGMQHSSELIEASDLLFQQVRDLGVPAFSCGYNIFERGEKECTAWMSDPNGRGLNPVYHIPLTEDPNFIRFYDSKENGEEFYVLEMEGERMQEHYRYLRRIDPEFDKAFSQLEVKGFAPPETQIHHLVNFDYGNVMFITLEPVPEAHDIFRRFGKVFEQTYRRFLDLQKAETQAREAQIEAALERVRSKTMAMHNSADVGDTVITMFDELVKLGIQSNRCGIVIFNESQFSEIWTAKSTDKDKGFLVIGHLDVSIHPLLENVRLAWERKDSFFSFEMEGEYLREYYQVINNYKEYPTSFNTGQLPERETLSDFFFSEGAIFAFTNEPLKTEATLIFKRFAGVFGQTYRRYLDLKKAESQAREARIEAALERIRAAAMAMHSSEDVSDATSVMFSQLDELGVETIRCGVALFNTETKSMEAWASTKSSNKRILQITGKIDMTIHPLLESLYDAWKSKKPVHRYDLRGDNLRSYYKAITEKSGFNLPIDNLPSKQTANSFFFPEGSLYAFTEKPLEGENAEIFKKFTKVFTLTYRRYLDLIEAEVRTREAIKQSSLDRVRGEIASMRTAKDLERITPLIWQELVSLDVPFIRCGVFIMNQDKRIIDNYLSTPDGKAIAAFHLPYDTPGFVSDVLSHWKKKQIFIEHWDARSMAEFADVLVNQGIFSSPDQYLKTLPEEGFYLHLLPFLQGMLYVGNLEQLSSDVIDLLQSLANAFSTAYARYDDFNRLELAKKQVDKTLVELKQAQQQLIQSEKMASLGELTAGIAHEIQNPLNFVNNFSELNRELLEELKAERSKLKGDRYEKLEDEIISDVTENQVKINEHGKRASEIVKSMLQHSRSSAGERELTDVNALCDEYMRLAYHGMRAKNKSFNAEYKLELDETLPKIKVVPQDIGRVLLNLINNAFQAITEVDNPRVTLITQQLNNSITIRIVDNGPGIPDSIRDKIFQPFFTTKPTGQGTGLGLSLSYDIIKAHGGEISINYDNGSGAEFIIILPVS